MSTQQVRGADLQKSERPSKGRRTRAPVENHTTVDQALHDIQYIRDIIDMSQDFFVSGWSGVSAGIITVAGAALSALIISRPERWDVAPTLWGLWIVIGLLLGLSDIGFYVKSCRQAARPVFSALLAKICLIEVIMAAQGVILTIVLIRTGATVYIPGAWLLAYGTTLTALGLFFPGGLWVMGLAAFFTSVAAFVVPSGGLWCVGFAGAATCLWGAAYLITRGK
jgi:hypothetical protein